MTDVQHSHRGCLIVLGSVAVTVLSGMWVHFQNAPSTPHSELIAQTRPSIAQPTGAEAEIEAQENMEEAGATVPADEPFATGIFQRSAGNVPEQLAGKSFRGDLTDADDVMSCRIELHFAKTHRLVAVHSRGYPAKLRPRNEDIYFYDLFEYAPSKDPEDPRLWIHWRETVELIQDGNTMRAHPDTMINLSGGLVLRPYRADALSVSLTDKFTMDEAFDVRLSSSVVLSGGLLAIGRVPPGIVVNDTVQTIEGQLGKLSASEMAELRTELD